MQENNSVALQAPLTRMYISRRKCEVVLAVAKSLLGLLECGTLLHTSEQPCLYDIQVLRYGLFS